MHTVEEARNLIAPLVAPLDEVDAPLEASLGRFLAAPVTSPVPLPPFDNSAMDGYAVRVEDLTAASDQRPVPLKLQGEIAAGDSDIPALIQGMCLRIFTGAPLPAGADGVVMQEDVRADGGTILFGEKPSPWENVRFAGEDVPAGAVIGAAGEKVTVARLALFAAAGIESIRVRRPVKASLLLTGAELTRGGGPLALGKIHESNGPMLRAALKELGAEVACSRYARDDLDETAAELKHAFSESDLVVSSGGVSVGSKDHARAALEAAGGEVSFWRVAMKPGKPLLFGRSGKKIFLGLPGNPVSAFVTFQVFGKMIVRLLQGADWRQEQEESKVTGKLAEAVSNPGERTQYFRVRIDRNREVRLSGKQGSHCLGALGAANGLLEAQPGVRWNPGEMVEVIRLG